MSERQVPGGENRMLPDDELQLKNAVQQHLDSEVENLDFNISSKLAAARHRALDQQSTHRSKANDRPWWNLPTLAGSTAVLVVALVIANLRFAPGVVQDPIEISTSSSGGMIEDLPILSSNDDLEFYQSIEFLEWIESNSG